MNAETGSFSQPLPGEEIGEKSDAQVSPCSTLQPPVLFSMLRFIGAGKLLSAAVDGKA